MTNFEQRPETDRFRYAQASEWQLRIAGNPSLEVSAEFQGWLGDPANERAFEGVSTAWNAAADFAVDPQLLDIRQAALRRARAASLERMSPSKILWRQLAAVFVGAAVIGSGTLYFLTAPTTFNTSTGERHVEVLPDGSQVALDSDTEVRVRYLKNARELELDHGRARFDVAHDISRPFSVTAGTETIIAVGTAFDVEKIGQKVLVTLIRGRIVVKNNQAEHQDHPTAGIPPALSLRAGQELVASTDAKPTITPANLAAANSWQSGRLVFNGDTLGEAVARENRYTDHPIQVAPSIAAIRIVGAFNAGDISSFVSAITGYFPVQATTTADNVVLLEPRS
jgi:transmembrane sensor